MSAIEKLLEGQNDFINPVSTALMDYGAKSPMNDEEAAKKEAACMIAGILIGVKDYLC